MNSKKDNALLAEIHGTIESESQFQRLHKKVITYVKKKRKEAMHWDGWDWYERPDTFGSIEMQYFCGMMEIGSINITLSDSTQRSFGVGITTDQFTKEALEQRYKAILKKILDRLDEDSKSGFIYFAPVKGEATQFEEAVAFFEWLSNTYQENKRLGVSNVIRIENKNSSPIYNPNSENLCYGWCVLARSAETT